MSQKEKEILDKITEIEKALKQLKKKLKALEQEIEDMPEKASRHISNELARSSP